MIGIDIIEVDRIRSACKNERFLKKVFTKGEIEYFRARGENYQTLAGFFCVKEAVAKALGSGIKFALTDVEVTHDDLGAPKAVLNNKAAALLGERKVEISLSHTESYATAAAIII